MLLGKSSKWQRARRTGNDVCGACGTDEAAASPPMKQAGRCNDLQRGRGHGTAGMRCPSRKTKTKRPRPARRVTSGQRWWPVPRPCPAGGIPGKSRVPTATARPGGAPSARDPPRHRVQTGGPYGARPFGPFQLGVHAGSARPRRSPARRNVGSRLPPGPGVPRSMKL